MENSSWSDAFEQLYAQKIYREPDFTNDEFHRVRFCRYSRGETVQKPYWFVECIGQWDSSCHSWSVRVIFEDCVHIKEYLALLSESLYTSFILFSIWTEEILKISLISLSLGWIILLKVCVHSCANIACVSEFWE